MTRVGRGKVKCATHPTGMAVAALLCALIHQVQVGVEVDHTNRAVYRIVQPSRWQRKQSSPPTRIGTRPERTDFVTPSAVTSSVAIRSWVHHIHVAAVEDQVRRRLEPSGVDCVHRPLFCAQRHPAGASRIWLVRAQGDHH